MSKPELYKILGEFDATNLVYKVNQLIDPEWLAWTKRKAFLDQKDSDTIVLINKALKYDPLFSVEMYNEPYVRMFETEINEIISIISSLYPEGEAKRIMLVRLPSGKEVKPHIDQDHHLQSCHRIHIPVITNDDVDFMVASFKVPMKVGTIVEINNNILHWVTNHSNIDRVHLMIDWNRKDDENYK